MYTRLLSSRHARIIDTLVAAIAKTEHPNRPAGQDQPIQPLAEPRPEQADTTMRSAHN